MIPDVKVLLETVPFEPFSIVTTGGKEYEVVTPDHADMSPSGNRLVIWFGDSSVPVPGLHIAPIHRLAMRAQGNS